MKKIIFLDVDGVLNSQDDFKGKSLYVLDEKKIKRLHKIIKKTGAEVVISSTWRKFEKMLNYLKENNVTWIGITEDFKLPPSIVGGHRGAEIEHWMDNNVRPDRYVIIDDEQDFLPHQQDLFVKTEWLTWNDQAGGLQEKHVRDAIRILNMGDEDAEIQRRKWRAALRQLQNNN